MHLIKNLNKRVSNKNKTKGVSEAQRQIIF